MSATKIKNRQTLYAVMRHDFSGKDVVCAVCADPQQADDLSGEYEQAFYDKGFSKEETYCYVTGTTFYS